MFANSYSTKPGISYSVIADGHRDFNNNKNLRKVSVVWVVQAIMWELPTRIRSIRDVTIGGIHRIS